MTTLAVRARLALLPRAPARPLAPVLRGLLFAVPPSLALWALLLWGLA